MSEKKSEAVSVFDHDFPTSKEQEQKMFGFKNHELSIDEVIASGHTVGFHLSTFDHPFPTSKSQEREMFRT